MERHGLPPHLFTDDPRFTDSKGRLLTDVGATAFWQGRQGRLSYEYDITNGSTQVLKFSCPVNFILQFQQISVDTGAVRFRAFRDTEGTAGGLFSTSLRVLNNNTMDSTPDYTIQATVTTGGTFTPDPVTPAETIRVRSGGATAQRTSITGSPSDERGLPPNDYYLLLENIAGAGEAEGVYTLRWEERPADIENWLNNDFAKPSG